MADQEEMALRQRKFKEEAERVRARLASMPELPKKSKRDQYSMDGMPLFI